MEDHAKALLRVVEAGNVGHTYNIGGDCELQNIELVRTLCSILDKEIPISKNPRLTETQKSSLESYCELIKFVADRPGHDMRYAIDAAKIKSELDWQPAEKSKTGFQRTVKWYLDHEDWWARILSGAYNLERQGLKK